MMRRMTFVGEAGSKHFDAMLAGFVLGQFMTVRVDGKGAGQSRDERRTDAAILGKLQAISAPDKDAPRIRLDDLDVEQRAVVDGAVLYLAQAEVDRLAKYLDRYPWSADRILAIEDALDFLSAAEKVEAAAT